MGLASYTPDLIRNKRFDTGIHCRSCQLEEYRVHSPASAPTKVAFLQNAIREESGNKSYLEISRNSLSNRKLI